MSKISISRAERPFTVAIDLGTSSARVVMYDAQARAIEWFEERTPYQMIATPDGGVEIEADILIDIISSTLDKFLQTTNGVIPDFKESIKCVAFSCFWHSVLGIDSNGNAITPLYNWSDTRSSEDTKTYAKQLGFDHIHQATGAIPHASYYSGKILWLRRTNPERYNKVAKWVSISEYFYLKLFGQLKVSVSIASGTGLFNPNQLVWNDEILNHLGISQEKLSPIANDSDYFTEMNAQYAKRWASLNSTLWFPAYGDGGCSNIGSGCYSRDTIALNLGTSGAMRVCFESNQVKIPNGLWCYRANEQYSLLGGALSNGGDVFAWCKKTLQLDEVMILEMQIAEMIPDLHGLTVLPFFSGERSTGWHDSARAAILGMNLSTRPIDILQASLEAITYRFAAIYERLKNEASPDAKIIVSGGAVLNSRVWTQMIADVMGIPVSSSAVEEASSRGAALIAMKSAGLIDNFDSVTHPIGNDFTPDMQKHEIYKIGRERHEKFYKKILGM